jgi:endonuclease/exonuclease/phosphatase family metal-dependent hydrolase
MDGEMLIIEEWTNYGIAMLWKPSLGNPKITTRILKRLTNSSDPEDRAYLIAEFSNFCFIATHYSLDQNDRNRMTDEIIAYAKAIGKPVYLGGDLNEWPHHEAIQKFKNNGFVILNDGTFTYPSSNPYKVLDMILGYKNSSTAHSFLSRGIPLFPRVDLRGSSDHLPYSITIELQ